MMTIIDGQVIAPVRIQRRRVRGWRKPAGVVVNCTRPGKYSNPYRIGWPDPMLVDHLMTRDDCLRMFKWYAAARNHYEPHWLDDLRAADYAMCYCRLDEKCHVDILLDML